MFLYEVLIRGDEKGLRGVHQILGRVVTDSDGDSHVKLGKAEAISVEVVSSILNESLAILLKNIDNKTQELQKIEDASRELSRKNEEAMAELARTKAAIASIRLQNRTDVFSS